MIEDKDNLPLLPNSWIWADFETLAQANRHALKAGPFGSALKKIFYTPHGFKIYGQEQVIREDPFYGDYYIDENRYEALKSCAVQPGDILISLVGTIGKVLVLPERIQPGIINPRLVKLSLEKSLVLAEYIKAYLESATVRSYFSSLSHGGTMEILNLTILKTLSIPLPPLNEQRRIVAKIEALKARIQQVKEALEAIPPLLEQFRQSVLAAAFRGDLTADWREENPDVEPASILLERIKEEVPEPKNKKADSELPDPFQIPDEWKWVSLSSICRSITDGDHQPPPKADKGVPFLLISNINNGKLDFSNIRYVPEEYYQSIQRHRKAEKGDLLYSVVGSYGIPVLVDTEDRFCFQRHIALLKSCYLISSKYLLYALKSAFVFRQATEVATGTTQLTVTLSGLRRIKVPLVSQAEQKEIVKRTETLLKIAEQVEEGYQEIKANIDQLDRSILVKAFRGELVPQDPNDEPASILLERIRAERAKQEAAAKTAKKSTNKTTGKRRKKTQQQDAESVQLGLPGLE